jgi:Protein of unknown function (DUF3617)
MRARIISVVSLIAASAPPAAADELLRPGAYDISVRLELPHIEDTNTAKSVALCFSGAAEPKAYGLAVLSGNNPLAGCPVSNVRRDGAALTFDIICAGSNLSRGAASCQLGGDRFSCRIEMKMGGKNMTMTEVQTGRRTGDCALGK